ncbi:MAG: hypothetical protein ACM3UW_02350 [Bacillota bacterium]
MITETKQEKRAGKMADGVQKVGIAGLILRLGKSLGFSALLFLMAIFFIYLGVPWYFGAATILLAIAIIVVEVVSLKRAAAVDLNAAAEPSPGAVELEPGEYLVHAIPAVMQYGKTRSVAVLGTGQVLTPENALLVTNQSLYAITVPLPGVDRVVAGTDIGKWQWMTAWQDITDRLQEMLSSLPLEEVLIQGRAKRLLKLAELKAVKTLPFTFALCFVTTDGRTYGYSIRVKEYYQRAKDLFQNQMKKRR